MDIYGRIENREIILTLEEIGSAIAEGTQVTFHYSNCGIDGEPNIRRDSNGKEKQYTVNPYQIISKNGHSYLICNLPEYYDLTHFRIDRIKDCCKTDVPSRLLRMLKGFETGIRLSEYIKSHPNLWSGVPTHITFQCKQYMMNDVADSFGTDIHIEELPDDTFMQANPPCFTGRCSLLMLLRSYHLQVYANRSLKHCETLLKNTKHKYPFFGTSTVI